MVSEDDRYGTLLGLLVAGVEDDCQWPVVYVPAEDWPEWEPTLLALRCVRVHDRGVRLLLGRTDKDNPTISLHLADEGWDDVPMITAGAET